MPYATNLPRRDRPRGLGEAADRAGSGFGTWIVDNFWGLSPKNISGQPRPYGQTVVQTLLPRSLQPRLMNLHMGPVIPGGTWPLLRRMNNQPVFRTPVERPGAVQMSLPPGAGAGPPTEAVPHNMAGFGWVPMGVAHRPSYLLEQPGLQGFGGFGQVGGELTIEAMGAIVKLDPSEVEWTEKNAATLRNIFLNFARTYLARMHQLELFDQMLEDLSTSILNVSDRIREAELIVFGDPLYPKDQQRAAARRSAAYAELQQLNQLRMSLVTTVSPPDTSSWPSDVRSAYLTLVNREAPGAAATAFGQAEVVAAAWWGWKAVKVAIGVAATLGIIGVGVAGVLIWQWLFEADKAAQIRSINAQADEREAHAKVQLVHAREVERLGRIIETAPTEAQRLAAMRAQQNTIASYNEMEGRQKSDHKNVPGGTGTMLTFGLLAAVAVIGSRYLLVRAGGRRKPRREEPRHERRRERRRERFDPSRRLLSGG
jgi:hypothetical protein